MRSRRSGFLVLLVGVVLASCDDEGPRVEPPAITIALAPDTATLVVGTTRQLAATVANSENSAVSWRTSSATIAEISATGLVTARAPGIATITAVALADTTKRALGTITVINPPLNVTVTIQSILQRGTTIPINAGRVLGEVTVTANIDVIQGAVDRGEILIDGVVVPGCTQSFATAPVTEGPIVCDINTAAYSAVTGATTYAGGPHTLTARAVLANGNVAASAVRELVFDNPSFMFATITPSRGPVPSVDAPRSIAPAGSNWHAGSITVRIVPVLFRRAPSDSIENVVVTLTTSGAGVSGVGSCVSTGVSAAGIGTALQDQTIAQVDFGGGQTGVNAGATPNCAVATAVQVDSDASNGFSVTFADSLLMSAGGVGQIEESLTFTITSTTRATMPGPVCINPGPNNPLIGETGVCGSGTGTGSPANRIPLATPWLHDNLAPRFTFLSIRKDTSSAVFFRSQTFTSGSVPVAHDTILGARTVDYGVGGQNAAGSTVFLAGLALDSMATFTNTSSLAESTRRYYFQARVTDGLNNGRTGTATTSRFAVASATGDLPTGGIDIQQFGVDFTRPTIAVGGTTPSDSSSTVNHMAPGGYVLTPSDAGIGPSGFSALPFLIRAELIAGTGTFCYDLEAGAPISCSTSGGTFKSDGTFNLASGVNGYWKITWQVADRAGNETIAVSRVHLVDATFPAIASITIPALAGGQSVSFNGSLTDNVDLKDFTPFTRYAENSIDLSLEERPTALGSYGPDPLSLQSNGTATMPNFIRSLESTAAGLPTSTVARATVFNYLVRDVLDNTTGQSINILSAVIAGIGGAGVETSWRGAGRPFSAAVNPVPSYQLTNAAGNVCVDSDGDGCTTPASIILTATATGPALTFGNPFARVIFYRRHPNTGRLVPIGTATASSSDNHTTNIRTWTYTGVALTVPSGLPSGTVHSVIAIGVDLSGRGLASAFVGFTQVAD